MIWKMIGREIAANDDETGDDGGGDDDDDDEDDEADELAHADGEECAQMVHGSTTKPKRCAVKRFEFKTLC